MTCAICGDEIERIDDEWPWKYWSGEWAHVEMHPRDGHQAQPTREVML